jgi:hypothetical protein
LYKGISTVRREVFNAGLSSVPRQKTDSKQTNKNLILSEEALVNTNLSWNYADDECTHGATIGRMPRPSSILAAASTWSQPGICSPMFAGDFIHRLKIEPCA